jgi:hypothetical protein
MVGSWNITFYPHIYLLKPEFEINLSVPTYLHTKMCVCVHADFLLDLFFDPEDGDDMFLRKDDYLSTNYMA